MRMNNTNYKQYDTRWASLGYPKKPWYIKNCGCGEVSICNCIIEMNAYASQTPKTIQPYCVQFAAPNGNGTYFSGIPTMMKHYGMTEVKEHATMPALFAELAKGNRVAILLMGNRKGGSKGVHWTSSAHFVACTGYKKSNGKDMLYIKDCNSTSSLRNGWLAYSENLRGDVSRVWSGKLNGALYASNTIADNAKLAIDGDGGINTVRHLQNYLGVAMTDGITIKEDLQKYVPALTAYDYGKGSPTVTALQKWLGLSDPDGLWGANTSRALQRKLIALGYLDKGEDDGIFSKVSMKALQRFLNDNMGKKAVYPEPSIVDKELAACKVQADYMRNSKYAWESNPTVAKSKKKGTCVTYVACVLQRIGILPSGSYVWHDGGKVYGNNNKMTVIYPKNKTLSQLKSELKVGDIVMDGNKNDNGSGSHIFILTGKWSGSKPIIWDNHSAQDGKGAYTYSRNRSVIAIVRLK
jgi:hypothetical protein